MLIYVVIEKEDNIPIITASTFEKAQQQLSDYMGWENPIHVDSVKYLGYKKIEYSEFEDALQGVYTFESLFPVGYGDKCKWEWKIQEFYLYELYLDSPQN